MLRPTWRLLPILLIAVLSRPGFATENGLRFIEGLPNGSDWQLLDTRPLSRCQTRSLKGARCLPASDLLDPNGRLPSLRDIVWLLGTLGLRGDETLVVAGRPGQQRDFIAGVLYLAGQRDVRVLRPPLGQSIASNKWPVSTGRGRSMAREAIYTAPPRDDQVVLRHELWRQINSDEPLRLLDARSEGEYWGHRIRGLRGGHIPGAEHWTGHQPVAGTTRRIETVVYGHAPLESIASFVRLQARWTMPLRVFIDGWRAWSGDSTLPADAESFAESAAQAEVKHPQGAVINDFRFDQRSS